MSIPRLISQSRVPPQFPEKWDVGSTLSGTDCCGVTPELRKRTGGIWAQATAHTHEKKPKRRKNAGHLNDIGHSGLHTVISAPASFRRHRAPIAIPIYPTTLCHIYKLPLQSYIRYLRLRASQRLHTLQQVHLHKVKERPHAGLGNGAAYIDEL